MQPYAVITAGHNKSQSLVDAKFLNHLTASEEQEETIRGCWLKVFFASLSIV